MLDGGACAFVGPTWQRLAEMGGENRVRHLVWQHGVEDPLARALDVHFPTKNFAAIKHEASRSSSAKIWLHLRIDRTWLRPGRQLFAEPFHRELFAIDFGLITNLLSQLRRWRRNDKVRRLVTGGGNGHGVRRGEANTNQEGQCRNDPSEASFHAQIPPCYVLVARTSLSKSGDNELVQVANHRIRDWRRSCRNRVWLPPRSKRRAEDVRSLRDVRPIDPQSCQITLN